MRYVIDVNWRDGTVTDLVLEEWLPEDGPAAGGWDMGEGSYVGPSTGGLWRYQSRPGRIILTTERRRVAVFNNVPCAAAVGGSCGGVQALSVNMTSHGWAEHAGRREQITWTVREITDGICGACGPEVEVHLGEIRVIQGE